ncbi:flavin reductase family protein [Candidatus Woesearchaeota archaeon]|nr:MAG: flavin reductase family protein [Candidatus Woesearchaeota archaeon]
MSIYDPRQTVLVTCRGTVEIIGKPTEKDDIATVHWHSPASTSPPLYAVFISKQVLADKIIRASQAFVVNFMGIENKEEIIRASRLSAEYSHKCEEVKLTEASCSKLVDCFRVKEALAWIECEVVKIIDAGDHTCFIGRIVHEEITREGGRAFHMGGEAYTTTRD